MFESSEDIINDLDQTLDRLLENANALEEIGENPLFSTEKEALTKTQESLMAHLVYMEALLEEDKPQRKARRRDVDAKIHKVKKRSSLRKTTLAQVLVKR